MRRDSTRLDATRFDAVRGDDLRLDDLRGDVERTIAHGFDRESRERFTFSTSNKIKVLWTFSDDKKRGYPRIELGTSSTFTSFRTIRMTDSELSPNDESYH